MKTVSSFKKLPVIAAVLMALAVFPGASMADKGDRHGDRGGHDKHYSHDRKKSHDKGHYRVDKHAGKSHHYDRHSRGYDKHHKHGKRWKGKHHGHHKAHAHNKHKHRGHGHRHGHGHEHTYVVNDYGHRPHYVGFDDLRFMIGLHNPNLDIVFRN